MVAFLSSVIPSWNTTDRSSEMLLPRMYTFFASFSSRFSPERSQYSPMLCLCPGIDLVPALPLQPLSSCFAYLTQKLWTSELLHTIAIGPIRFLFKNLLSIPERYQHLNGTVHPESRAFCLGDHATHANPVSPINRGGELPYSLAELATQSHHLLLFLVQKPHH